MSCNSRLLDGIILSINNRFQQPSFEVYKKMELLLKSVESKDASAKMMLQQEKCNGEINLLPWLRLKPISAVRCKALPKSKLSIMSNTAVILKLLQVNPVTSATTERSFPLARRMKSWLSSTILVKYFNSLTILTHQQLKSMRFCWWVASKSGSRRLIFGQFWIWIWITHELSWLSLLLSFIWFKFYSISYEKNFIGRKRCL